MTALHPVENDKIGTYWLFRCDYGNEKDMLLQNVKSGKSTSCGRCKNQLGTTEHTQRGVVGNSFDLTGQRFGKLVAIKRIRDKNSIKYLCKCDCGNECIKTSFSLKYHTKYNGTNSCGCIQKTAAGKAGASRIGSLIGKRFNHLTVKLPCKKRWLKTTSSA